MTYAVCGGGGSPKSRKKEQNQLMCYSDKGGGVKKYENFADVIYGSPLRRRKRNSGEFIKIGEAEKWR